jgi:hypothetical protein
MVALISFLLNVVVSLFKSKSRLEAENAALRHQLIVPQRKVRDRVPFMRRLHMPGLNTDHRQTRFSQCAVQPL